MSNYISPYISFTQLLVYLKDDDTNSALRLLRREWGHMVDTDPNTTLWEKMRTVQPEVGDLRWAQGRAPTPHGPVISRWRRGRQDSSFALADPAARSHGSTCRCSATPARSPATDRSSPKRDHQPLPAP